MARSVSAMGITERFIRDKEHLNQFKTPDRNNNMGYDGNCDKGQLLLLTAYELVYTQRYDITGCISYGNSGPGSHESGSQLEQKRDYGNLL
jgi:hypothetical protein